MGKQEAFIVEGALAKCSQSKVPMVAKLAKVLDNQFTKSNGSVTATTMTLGPTVFGVQPFGICNMIPPTPAMPTPPCVCAPIKWDGAYADQSIGPLRSNPLTTGSKATCALGGKIEFVTSGQLPKPFVVMLNCVAASCINPVRKKRIEEKINFRIPEGVDLSEEKSLLQKHPRLASNDNILYKVHTARALLKTKFPDKNLDEFFQSLSTVKGGKNYNDTCDTLIEFMVTITTKDVTVNNIETVLGELRTHNNTQIGEEWVLRNLARDLEPNSTVIFEKPVVSSNNDDKSVGDRRVDAIVECDGERTYVEYKSVKGVPPGDFQNQFAKDMRNTNNNIDPKVQWKFDGDKLAREFYKDDPQKGNVTWGALADDEKEAVRADFREKMRPGIADVEMDEGIKNDFLCNDSIFDATFIIS